VSERAGARARRADYLFAAYVAGGVGKRVYPLHEFLTDLQAVGIDVSLGTLKRDSTESAWQARAKSAWRTQQAEQIPELHRAVRAAELRCSRIAGTLLDVGGRALQEILDDEDRISALHPAFIARFLDLGVRVDRQTAETVQSLHDLTVDIWNDVLLSVVRIFLEINVDPIPESRAASFGELLDALATDRIRAARGEASE